jgi:hypothetical protein
LYIHREPGPTHLPQAADEMPEAKRKGAGAGASWKGVRGGGKPIIRTFQLVFLAKTVFFSHNKSANSTFSHSFSAKQTGP